TKGRDPEPIAIPVNGGWRYNYGNQFYVQLVSQYLTDTSPTEFDDETVQVIMDEALKYEGFPYVFGGASPTTSFDCSGLIQWVYDKAGISLPRVAQDQYDATQEISMEEAQAGDLIFFHSTYNAGTYVTHVAIYLEGNRFYHAGDPI
ncbi:peptidase P60, partial [Staphylococcus pseudintermedius]|uniref:C40 family peptidase n=1 Tax=Staphylococcus pseudintermedius TaxID=283734 RepID=UPI000E3910E3